MQISDNLVQYITAEIIRRLGLSLAPAKPALCLVGSRHDLGAQALAALEEHFEVTERAQWNHRLPAEAALLFTPPFLAASGLKAAAPKSAPSPVRAVAAPSGRRPVITESEVMRLCPPSGGEGQELRLEAGTVVTPLAHDYIRAMKINLI